MDQSGTHELPSHADLSRLARENPAEYEDLRLRLIDDLIGNAPAELQHRLRGLQFRIDGVRRLAHNPLNSTLQVYSMMWASFNRLNDELSGFDEPACGASDSARMAQVIPFGAPPGGAHP
jgi:hypothetical protein